MPDASGADATFAYPPSFSKSSANAECLSVFSEVVPDLTFQFAVSLLKTLALTRNLCCPVSVALGTEEWHPDRSPLRI